MFAGPRSRSVLGVVHQPAPAVQRVDHDETIRLPQIAGDLGQELVRRHTDRRHQPQLVADGLLVAFRKFGLYIVEHLKTLKTPVLVQEAPTEWFELVGSLVGSNPATSVE